MIAREEISPEHGINMVNIYERYDFANTNYIYVIRLCRLGTWTHLPVISFAGVI